MEGSVTPEDDDLITARLFAEGFFKPLHILFPACLTHKQGAPSGRQLFYRLSKQDQLIRCPSRNRVVY